MISQYLYISTAPGLSNAEVDELSASSSKNNAARSVTGFLLYNGRNFLQLLEGDKSALDDLMAKIEKDPRHDGFSILYQGEASDRSCPQWGMKWVRIAESVDTRRELLERDLPQNLDDQVRNMILNYAMLN